MNRLPRILIIRRDNIGDLICTTPLLHAVREKYPEAYVAVLVSSYNQAVLNDNPDVDEVFVFLKRQQKNHGYSLPGLLWHRWRLIRTLRRLRFDYILLANGGWRYGRQLGGKTVIGFRERDNPDWKQPDVVVSLPNGGLDDHEVSKVAHLGEAIGVPGALGRLWLFPDKDRVHSVREKLKSLGWDETKPSVAVHISSRQPVQRWAEASFVELIRGVLQRYQCQVLLLWSPGPENEPMHPGDDEKAERIMSALAESRSQIFPCTTEGIEVLVATLSLADQMICSDGGAMHVAAALGKPILCFFGHSSRIEWHPWQVPYVLLQPETRVVKDISVDEALTGFAELQTLCACALKSRCPNAVTA